MYVHKFREESYLLFKKYVISEVHLILHFGKFVYYAKLGRNGEDVTYEVKYL